MSIYKLSLMFAEVLGLLIAGFWIIYIIKKLQIDDLLINISIYILFIYVSTGELFRKFTSKEEND